jgi:hypothetical protein
MKIELEDLEVGSKVWCCCYSGFCYNEIENVTHVTFKYDENTGVEYKIIHTSSQTFDGRDGAALEAPMAYYIQPCEQ